jgi:hypothetical protein
LVGLICLTGASSVFMGVEDSYVFDARARGSLRRLPETQPIQYLPVLGDHLVSRVREASLVSHVQPVTNRFRHFLVALSAQSHGTNDDGGQEHEKADGD